MHLGKPPEANLQVLQLSKSLFSCCRLFEGFFEASTVWTPEKDLLL